MSVHLARILDYLRDAGHDARWTYDGGPMDGFNVLVVEGREVWRGFDWSEAWPAVLLACPGVPDR